MQTPPQSIWFPGQVTAQLPPTQILPSREQSMPSVPVGPTPGVQMPLAPQ
jgi:hypothetical protein